MINWETRGDLNILRDSIFNYNYVISKYFNQKVATSVENS